jgi:hypothetical protein
MSPVTLAPGRRRPCGPARPAIRLRPAPALEPPYDDEVTSTTWAGPGIEQLALDFDGTPFRVGATRPAPADPGGRIGASEEAIGAVSRFVRLCLEILNGYRPTGHLRPVAKPAEAATIIEQIGTARDRVTALNRRGAGYARPGPTRPRPVSVRRLRVCEPRAGVAEAAVVLATNGRTLALALRLERRRDRWLCTAAHAV